MPRWFIPALFISGALVVLSGLRRIKDKSEGKA